MEGTRGTSLLLSDTVFFPFWTQWLQSTALPMLLSQEVKLVSSGSLSGGVGAELYVKPVGYTMGVRNELWSWSVSAMWPVTAAWHSGPDTA